jgi:spermidine/putrescine transport system substrate-binding protein
MTEMLTRPDLAGRVAVFTEMRDTVGLIMLDQGADPSDFTDEEFDAAIALLQESVDSGHVRQFADANYGQQLSRGNYAASMTYSGDINQLRLDNPSLQLVIPEAGFVLWSDNMLIPVGATHQQNAEAWMDFYYRPEVAAEVAAWVNFITPVKGAKEELAATDPDLADNELIFPSEEFLAQGSIFKALDEEEEARYQEAFNQVRGL